MTRSTFRSLAILVGALVTLGVIAVATAGISGTDQNNPSSRSAGKLGTLALYTWFQDLGLHVHRVAGSFTVGATDMLIEYEPTIAFTSDDLATMVSLVKGGGDLVLVGDESTISVVQPLLDALDVAMGRPVAGGDATPEQPFDSTGRVRSVPMGPGFSVATLPNLVPLLRSGDDVVAAALRLQDGGRAYVFGSTLPFSNDGLRHDDSPYLLLSLLQRARGGRIAFDEYHHGEGGQAAEGAAAIFNGPIGVAAVLFTGLAFTALAVNGRRLGRSVAAGDAAAVPSATGYVAAMGHLFARTRQRGAVAARYADELKRRIGALTGIDSHLDDMTFVAAIEGSEGSSRARALRELLERLRSLQASAPNEAQLLRAAREVDSVERAWADGAQLRR